MTTTLAITDFAAHYRLPPAAASASHRLDRLAGDRLSGALDRAFRELGVEAGEEICIRHLRVPVHLKLAATDEVLAREWAAAVAARLREAILHPGTEPAAGSVAIVRFPSRRWALIDAVLGVLRGDFRRAWAWRQLGLDTFASLGPASSPGAVSRAVADGLTAEPEAIVPVLEVAARSEMAALVRIREEDWIRLACAALAVSGLPVALALSELGIREEAGGVEAAAAAMGMRRQALTISLRSRLADVAALLPARSGTAVRALAVLAILEVEPAALRAGGERALALVEAVGETLTPFPSPTRTPDPRERGATAYSEIGTETPADPSSEVLSVTSPLSRGGGEDAGRGGQGVRVSPRLRAWTDCGGLLFLVHVVDELALIDAVFAHPGLAARPLVWTLHQLARRLAEVAPEDPAALAFAGLPPDADPPESTKEITPTEEAALEEWAARIWERAAERMAPAEDAKPLLHRRAEVVADPGWIEIHLSLEQVSLDVRRAGLDVDPGYVAWLGVVLRFVYE